MTRFLLKSKIHNAVVTDANIDYVGSITLPEDLMEAANLWGGEKVLVASISKGNRLETYVLKGPRGSRNIVINGGAAHVIGAGERVTVMAFAAAEEPIEPRIVLCDGSSNQIVRLSGV